MALFDSWGQRTACRSRAGPWVPSYSLVLNGTPWGLAPACSGNVRRLLLYPPELRARVVQRQHNTLKRGLTHLRQSIRTRYAPDSPSSPVNTHAPSRTIMNGSVSRVTGSD